MSPRKEEVELRDTSTTRMGTTREDTTQKLPVFYGTGRDDAEQHWFTCEAVWAMKQMLDEQAKIARLETMFKERALT